MVFVILDQLAWTKEQNTPSFSRDVSATKAKDLMISYGYEMLGHMIIADNDKY